MIKAKLLGATAAAESLAIEDVFSTYLYTGNGSTQTITNGIDLAGEGGLVWLKARSLAYDHFLYDTNRGATKVLRSNLTNAEATLSGVTSFNSNGFSLGPVYNDSAATFASWTFRQAPRFFDVVTYTGNGSSIQQVSHNLDVAPGAVFIKRTDSSSNWVAYTNYSGDYIFNLNNTNSRIAAATATMQLTSTIFTATTGETDAQNNTNINGATYVAYLFAHDPLGPSGDGSDGLIACGSYTGNGSATGPTVSLGWEPQWLMIKRATGIAGNWQIVDDMRGMFVGYADATLQANLSNAESSTIYVSPNSTGFQVVTVNDQVNASGSTYIYIAIRRGPMREPTVGTQVFSANTFNAGTGTTITTGFPVDFQISQYRTSANNNNLATTRLCRVDTATQSSTTSFLDTSTTAAESAGPFSHGWDNIGFKIPSGCASQSMATYNFRRAPGFFDVVAYTGTGVARTINHNLGVAPELMIIKSRSAVNGWAVYAQPLGNTGLINLNWNFAAATGQTVWNSTTPSASTFSVEGSSTVVNQNGTSFIAYLFASLPGISKVGSYTGNGTSQTINCAFTTGARFVLIKRRDSTGDWYVWDTARGIVSGNDPRLILNTTAAEVTTDDTIDPDNSGFIVNQVAATNVNVNAATYIFLAIA